MAFVAVLIYVAIIFVRPGEILPGWEDFPFAMTAEVIAALLVGASLLTQPRRVLNQPLDVYVGGFFTAAVLSNPSWGWLGGAWPTFVTLAPTIICYVLVRCAVHSPKHLRWMGFTLVAFTLFQAANGIVQFRGGVGLGNIEALEQSIGQTPEGDAEVRRIRGTGIFNDPNDLAMAFVGIVPFLVGPLVAKAKALRVRVFAAALLAPILEALLFTNSRGGVLGLGAALLPYCWRMGKLAGAFLAAIFLVGIVALGPSRLNQMDAEEDSAQGRVQSWSAGLQMLRSRPVLGIGFGRYTEFNPLVAHNSFVHTFGELGFGGAFFFTGMFYWLLRDPERATADRVPAGEVTHLRSWGHDLRSGSLGMLTCAMFLSRQYVIVLFIWFAMGACYRQVLQEMSPSSVTLSPNGDAKLICVVTVSAIAGVYVTVRLLAVWSGGG